MSRLSNAFDRDKAREVLRQYERGEWVPGEPNNIGDLLDALAGCVTDEPPTIDRDALIRILYDLCDSAGVGEDDPVPGAASDVLALLRPAPAQTIDRDAAIEAAERAVHRPLLGDLDDGGDLRVAVTATDAVLALLRPDPRIAKLEALLERADRYSEYDGLVETYDVRAILHGQS